MTDPQDRPVSITTPDGDLTVPASSCGVPQSERRASFRVTVVPMGDLGDLDTEGRLKIVTINGVHHMNGASLEEMVIDMLTGRAGQVRVETVVIEVSLA